MALARSTAVSLIGAAASVGSGAAASLVAGKKTAGLAGTTGVTRARVSSVSGDVSLIK